MDPACACHDTSTMSPYDMARQDHVHWSKSDFGFSLFVKVGTLKHFRVPYTMYNSNPVWRKKVKPRMINAGPKASITVRSKSRQNLKSSTSDHRTPIRTKTVCLPCPSKETKIKAKAKAPNRPNSVDPHQLNIFFSISQNAPYLHRKCPRRKLCGQ